MSEFNDRALTQQVLDSFANTPDPRRKMLISELVVSLHEFVRKTNLTFEEWDFAIDFLTRTGQKCTATRQEFILLSDVFGVSMLVDAVNHGSRDDATETTVLGPFYVGEHKPMPHGSDISAGIPGEPLFVSARVTGLNEPLANVAVDVWHADGDGFYDSQKSSYETQGASLRARFITGSDGRFSFRTILPCSYPVPTDGPVGQLLAATDRHAMRPAHVHFLINAAGFEPLVTHVFVEGDEYLNSDAVFGVKDDLISRIKRHDEPIMPDGSPASGPWYEMKYEFRVRPGTGHVPQPLTAAAAE
ncbi:hydroxyquinol 1,2-dioxygenase [Bradyrhizobium diazoefficiens]|uniref:dioxygenase family protein n=1 Tax=Bradyrhizobium diazoefficiens TaxID=1355477 RepID=UPI003519B6C9